MTRNSDKFKTPPEIQEKEKPKPEAPEPHQSHAQANNPFGLSFVTPTDKVFLPTGGRFYPKGHPLHGVESIEVKHMTAKEEDILSSTNPDEGNIYDILLDSLVVRGDLKSSHFLEEDKIAVLLSARITGFGSTYKSATHCFACGKTADREYDLTKKSISEPDVKANYNEESDTFLFELPSTKIQVELSNSSEDIEKALEEEKKQKKKYNLEYNKTISFLQRVIVSANSISERPLINQMIESLPAIDARSIKEFYSNCRPSLSLKQETTCPLCDTTDEREAPFSWALFRTDV